MTDKAVISEYTYRSLESQRTNAGDNPVFVLPYDLPQLFRSTTRKGTDLFECDSLAVLAESEGDFREFLANVKTVKAKIFSREDDKTFIVNGNCENIIKWWKDARRKGAGKIGGDMAGKVKRAATADRCKGLTKEEWTNGAIKNAQLVEKYDTSINSLKRYAADKGWGHDRQRAIIRKELRNAKR